MPRPRSRQVAWRLFLQAHALLTKRVDAALLAADCVSFDTYDVLITLAEAPGRRLRMSELAGATFFSNSGISRRVARLEQDGLMSRVGSKNDGRVFFAVLTEAGHKALREAWQIYERVIEEDFGKAMNSSEARDLAKILGSVVGHIGGRSGGTTEAPPE